MPKPDKWNTAHAERERRKRREEKMAGPAGAITLGSIGDMIRQTEQFYEMQAALGGAMGIAGGAGTLGSSFIEYDSVGYEQLVVNTLEYRAMQAELEATKALLAERDEIIAALSADLGEIDSLREENVRLKTKAPDVILPGPWIEWHGGECPVPAGAVCDIKVGLTHGQMDTARPFTLREGVVGAEEWRWAQVKDAYNIVAYRVVG